MNEEIASATIAPKSPNCKAEDDVMDDDDKLLGEDEDTESSDDDSDFEPSTDDGNCERIVIRKSSSGSTESSVGVVELEKESENEIEKLKKPEEEERIKTPEPPVIEPVDEGAEADSEPEVVSVTQKENPKSSKKTKSSPTKKRKRKKKSEKRKGAKMDGSDVLLSAPEKKRKRGSSNKRKKIRKLLREEELQEDTLKALREEEERQKRLLEREDAAKAERATNSAGVSFQLLDDDQNGFQEMSFDLSLLDDIDLNIRPVQDDLSSQLPLGQGIPQDNDTKFKMEEFLVSQSSSATTPSVCTVSTEASMMSSTTATTSSTDQTLVEQKTLVTSSEGMVAPTSTLTFAPLNSMPPPGGKPSIIDSLALSSAPVAMLAPIPFQSSHFPPPLLSPQQPRFYPPFPAAPKAPSGEVICISSESSDDEWTKKQKEMQKQNQQPLQQQQQPKKKQEDTICISSGSESSDDVIFAGTDDNDIVDEDPDVNNSGMHVNDELNCPDEQGRVLVNKNRPPDEPEIYLSPRLARAVKPHQIGGIRFMFDNIIESLEHFKKSAGFGCILAHSMGLGKTLQVISFVDVFLRHTGARTALCVVPVNTLLNWIGEFEMWLPQMSMNASQDSKSTGRNFKVRLLSDAYKTTEARAQVIALWKSEGGVLLMGYEMFRLLTNQKSRKRKKKKSKNAPLGGVIETIDIDEEDKITEITAEIYEHLVNPGPDLIVCDEGHRIKNSHASISQALKQIATRRRIVLTGYPLQNNLMEYWCMVDFVRPNFLGTRQEFANMFERPICNGQCADSNEQDVRLMRFRSHVLHSLLKGFVQRRSHLVLKNSLPPKEEYVLLIRMSTWQKTLYNNFIKLQKDQGSGSMCSSLNPIKAFSICCKIWNHPDVLYRAVICKTLEYHQNGDGLLDIDLDLPEAVIESIMKKARRKREAREKVEAVAGSNGKLVQGPGFNPFGEEKEKGISYDWAVELLQDYSPNKAELSGKLIILMKILEESVSKGDKILVFSQSLTTLTIIEEFLSYIDVPNPPNTPTFNRKWAKNESYFRLDGNTSSSDREKMIQQFNDKENNKVHLFLLSTRAGCLGINLVGANRVIVFDISWNPCHDAQAVCRVYRYGQTKKCIIYRLICDQTMEKKIYDRQISKQGMSDRVVDELNPVQNLERQDITKLLIYDDNDLPMPSTEDCEKDCSDEILSDTLKINRHWLTKAPFHHESLLMDCKGSRLTKAEKRAAQKSYEQEKRASSSCNYSRPSYVNFYAAAGYPSKTAAPQNNAINKSTGAMSHPVANVRPIQSTPYPLQVPNNNQPPMTNGPESQIITVLRKSGIEVQKTVAVQDIPLPNSTPGPHTKPLISQGESFYLINGVKGFYIGTSSGRIFALRSKKQDADKAPSPLVQAPGGQMLTTRERESQIIKTAFNSMIRRNPALRQQSRNPYAPRPMSQQPSSNGFPPAPMNYSQYRPPSFSDIKSVLDGSGDGSNGNFPSPSPSNFLNQPPYYQRMPSGNPPIMMQPNVSNGDTISNNPILDNNFHNPVSMVTTSNNMFNRANSVPSQFQDPSNAPQLSSLLNYGMYSQPSSSSFDSSMDASNSASLTGSNWMSMVQDSDLIRGSSVPTAMDTMSHNHNGSVTESGNSLSQGQSLFTDSFLTNQQQALTDNPIQGPTDCLDDINGITQTQNGVMMQSEDVINTMMPSQQFQQLVDSTVNP